MTGCMKSDATICTKAIWRAGIGCTLVDGLTEAELRAQDLGDQTALDPLNATQVRVRVRVRVRV